MALTEPKLRFDKRQITTSDSGHTFDVMCRFYYWDGHSKVYHSNQIANVLPENLTTEIAELDDAAETWFNAQVGP